MKKVYGNSEWGKKTTNQVGWVNYVTLHCSISGGSPVLQREAGEVTAPIINHPMIP